MKIDLQHARLHLQAADPSLLIRLKMLRELILPTFCWKTSPQGSVRQSKHLAHGGAMCNMDGGFLFYRMDVPQIILNFNQYPWFWGSTIFIYTIFAGDSPYKLWKPLRRFHLQIYSYSPLPVISTCTPIYRMHNPIYNQLYLIKIVWISVTPWG